MARAARVPAPIVLFDLDGTVLTFEGPSPGPGRMALERAMHELHGLHRATDGIRLAGGTDRAVARAMIRRAKAAEDDASITQLIARYVEHLAALLLERRYRPIGEVAQAADALRGRGAIVAVATGNAREGARLKCRSAGVVAAFDESLGGFGCEAELRADILRLAVARCGGAAGVPVVVVGDTDRDVLAARAIGARVVGVAINAECRAELQAAGADAIVDACGDELVRAVLDR
jgi:phosphoglycolate phosphatase